MPVEIRDLVRTMRIVSQRVVREWGCLAGWTAVSGCDEWQAGAEIVAEWCDGFQRHVACSLHGPFDGMDHPSLNEE